MDSKLQALFKTKDTLAHSLCHKLFRISVMAGLPCARAHGRIERKTFLERCQVNLRRAIQRQRKLYALSEYSPISAIAQAVLSGAVRHVRFESLDLSASYALSSSFSTVFVNDDARRAEAAHALFIPPQPLNLYRAAAPLLRVNIRASP